MTGDSLLKMLAIVYRIRCGIPVILMGECGCGKTMLISYLCLWLGVRLISLDIHGGTTEADIIAVFQVATEYLSTGQTEVYVFLDEVNTCASMGIIAEAICHRSLNGIRLPEGVKILAALNPYRMKPDIGDGAVGLEFVQQNLDEPSVLASKPSTSATSLQKKRKKIAVDPMKRLVYRVHPIPQTMQDYIFDFGGGT